MTAEPAPALPRNTEFDPLAAVYNRCWGAEYHANCFPVVDQFLLQHLPEHAPVLDVCCGTGQFTRRVTDLGFRLTGIDASPNMIEFARTNVPAGEFHVSDVRSFSLGRKFLGAYSVFESLNHVPDLPGLERAFRCVHHHLENGARFLFDLNGQDAFENFWNGTHAIVQDDIVCVLRSEYDHDLRQARCNVTLFEHGVEWKRSDFALEQTAHSLDEVHRALYDAGFSGVTLIAARDAGMSRETGFDRTFFLAEA